MICEKHYLFFFWFHRSNKFICIFFQSYLEIRVLNKTFSTYTAVEYKHKKKSTQIYTTNITFALSNFVRTLGRKKGLVQCLLRILQNTFLVTECWLESRTNKFPDKVRSRYLSASAILDQNLAGVPLFLIYLAYASLQ